MPTRAEQIRLWQLISPLLPVGAFHYSQGLEHAVHRAWVRDKNSATSWLYGVLNHSISYVDLPILMRAHEAWSRRCIPELVQWDRLSRACRETRELRNEEHDMGRALRRLATGLNEPMPEVALGFTATFAVCSANASIEKETAAFGYSWAWCENLVSAAVKLIPLGYVEGQHILRHLGEALEGAVTRALACDDEDIGHSVPGVALASGLHETQYSRLFRS